MIGARIESWIANCGNTEEELTLSVGNGANVAKKQHLVGAQGKQRSWPDKKEQEEILQFSVSIV